MGKVDDRITKLRKRGFHQEGADELCPSCKLKARSTWRVARRDIDWCKACNEIRSWKRGVDDSLVEDVGFDLDRFLE